MTEVVAQTIESTAHIAQEVHSLGSPLLYTIFAIVVAVMILIDMFALKASGDHRVSVKEALIWTLIWITVALLFMAGIWGYIRYMLPPEILIPREFATTSEYATSKALEFLTGYIVEKSLSIDNIFIFLLIFSFFKVPNIYQRRVLVYGVLAAVFLRVVMVLIGSFLISKFEWILYVFGAFPPNSGASPAARRLSAVSSTAAKAAAASAAVSVRASSRSSTAWDGALAPEAAQSSSVRAAVSGDSSRTCTAAVSQVISGSVLWSWGTPSREITARSIAAIRMFPHVPSVFQHIMQMIRIPPQTGNSLFFPAKI